MPASQEIDDYLTVNAKPIRPPDSVFFTDQSPEFEVEIANSSEYHFTEGSQITWATAIGDGRPRPVHSGTIDIDLEPNESKTYIVEDDLLSFEGHGVFGIAFGGHSGQDTSNPRKLHSRPAKDYDPLYTFTVWDRSHYETVHEQPKDLQ
ncbi:hypothetical protein HYG81_20610 (plasmid) [Natrinema zhouii]|uniref:hypothetical protein n=1 Tax=Natrinema zhouii TaxID=1710539 RepID=UPI001CFF7EA0|nr:hypothetical protein [Natrinema zhouii]UHQ98025.1 hypothetical protein HYG81_20610 [Natrinema zhouii]